MRTTSSVFAIVAAGCLAGGCSTPQASEPRPAQPVRTQAVAPAPPQSGIRYSAGIEAFDEVSLAFKATGYVDSLLRRTGADGRVRAAQAGDRVARGAVLAHVQETDARERVNQGRSRLADSEAAFVKANLDLERARTLFASDSLTKPELDAAQATFDSAAARVASARADIELALSALRDCTLTSPLDGVVLERRIELGALAGAGTIGFVVADLSSVKARFGIPDSMIQSVRLGENIDVTVEAVGASAFAGRVTAIAPTADPQSRVFDVEVTIPNRDGRLRPGMIGTVSVSRSAAAASASPLVVPLTAVVRSQAGTGHFAVVVVERRQETSVARVRRVELGEVVGNAIAVLKGLNAGEQVVVSGATLLVDGDPIRVLDSN